MKIIKKIIIFSSFFSAYAEGPISCEGSAGVGWFMSSRLLLPQEKAVGAGLLSVANDNTAWNMFTSLSAEIKGKLRNSWYVKGEVGGELLRNGRASVTDSNQLFFSGFILGVAAGEDVSVFLNAIDVAVALGNSISLDENINCVIEGGYIMAREYEVLTFLEQPLIFFKHARYRAGFLKCTLNTRVHKSRVSLAYKMALGIAYSRSTQNTGNTVVLRRVPKVLSNGFSCKYTYEISEGMEIGLRLSYGNSRNHALGRSLTYENGSLTLDLLNVLSTLGRKIGCAITFEYEF